MYKQRVDHRTLPSTWSGTGAKSLTYSLRYQHHNPTAINKQNIPHYATNQSRWQTTVRALPINSLPNKSHGSPPLFNLSTGVALLTSTLGLLLCSAQTFKGHIDASHERDRMQEMHEQKMHYLHEFHRREIHARDARLGLLEGERVR